MKIRCIKVFSFILFIALVSVMLSYALTPSSYMRVVLHDVRTAPEPYDMVFLGQSRGETNINPYVLDEVVDYYSYNLCRRILRMSDMYYLADESNLDGNVKVMVLDIDHAYWMDSQISYYSDAYLLPHLTFSNKVDYFMRYVLSADYRVALSRFNVEGVDDLKNSVNRIKLKLSKEYRDYSMDAVSSKDVDHVYVGRGYHEGIAHGTGGSGAAWDVSGIEPSIIDDVERLAEYCAKHNIKLVAIHAPLPHERFTDEEHDSIRAYFNSTLGGMGIDYIDFNYVASDILSWSEEDYSDGEGHMMSSMADRYSRVLGEVLQLYLEGADYSYYFTSEVNH